jgi:GNAT superfamily N-acetyltransferase
MSNRINILEAAFEEAEFVDNQLVAFNTAQVPFKQEKVINKNYVIKDDEKIIAGLNAILYSWKILHIDILFVDKDYRRKGLGTKLLQYAESEARAIGSTLVHIVRRGISDII